MPVYDKNHKLLGYTVEHYMYGVNFNRIVLQYYTILAKGYFDGK